jgi:hypothetical protein
MPNDLELIRWAGLGVAMANGHPELREAAPTRSPRRTTTTGWRSCSSGCSADPEGWSPPPSWRWAPPGCTRRGTSSSSGRRPPIARSPRGRSSCSAGRWWRRLAMSRSAGPAGPPLPWLALSAPGARGLRQRALVGAYRHGDFSLAYPLARGGGALVAAVGGGLLLGDELGGGRGRPSPWSAAGLISLVGRASPPPACATRSLTAAFIGTYTLSTRKGPARHQRARLRPVHRRRGGGLPLRLELAGAGAQRCGRRSRGVAHVAPGRVVHGGGLRPGAGGDAAGARWATWRCCGSRRWSSAPRSGGWCSASRFGGHRLASSVVILVGLVGLVVAST